MSQDLCSMRVCVAPYNRCSASAVPVDDRFGQLLDRLSQSEQSDCELVALPHATRELARDYR